MRRRSREGLDCATRAAVHRLPTTPAAGSAPCGRHKPGDRCGRRRRERLRRPGPAHLGRRYGGQISAFGPKSYAGRTLTAAGVSNQIEPGGESDGQDFAFGSDLSEERLNILADAEVIILHADSEEPDELR